MRTLMIGLAAFATLFTALPIVSASAETVVVREHHDRGLHRGEWRRHHAKKVVIIKRDRGHHYGRGHFMRDRD